MFLWIERDKMYGHIQIFFFNISSILIFSFIASLFSIFLIGSLVLIDRQPSETQSVFRVHLHSVLELDRPQNYRYSLNCHCTCLRSRFFIESRSSSRVRTDWWPEIVRRNHPSFDCPIYMCV